MKSYLLRLAPIILAFVLGSIALAGIERTYEYLKKKAIPEEISVTEYKLLFNQTLRYPSFKWLIYDKFHDDGKITRDEFVWLEDMYGKIARASSISFFLVEKSQTIERQLEPDNDTDE